MENRLTSSSSAIICANVTQDSMENRLILLNSQLFMYCCYLSSTYDSIENKLTLSSSPIVCVIVACYSIFAIVYLIDT
jgi:hypothetical protein